MASLRSLRSPALLALVTLVTVAVVGCAGSEADESAPDRTSAPSVTTVTTATTTTVGPTTTTTSPAAGEAQAGLVLAADLGPGWAAGTYDPNESGSPCGDTNTDADIPATAKVGSIASSASPEALFQEDVRVYDDPTEAGRAFAGLLSEVDCPSGSASDGNGGTIVIDIGPSVPLADVQAPFDEGLTKTFSTDQYEGSAALVRAGSRVVTVRYLHAKGAAPTGLRDLKELLELSLTRLAPG